jgi:hypothetical protein
MVSVSACRVLSVQHASKHAAIHQAAISQDAYKQTS